MHIDVVLLPRDLQAEHLHGRSVVVFDVLRATTSMVAALSAGMREIRIFGDIRSAAAAHGAFPGVALLCGEEKALPPPGFDLGNSPGAFTPAICSGRTSFFSTTNGTRAIFAAHGASEIYIGALVNASAVARTIVKRGLNVTLLCSGTNGQVAMEDLLGCGAVIAACQRIGSIEIGSDTARIARRLFEVSRDNLPAALRETQGGQNVIGVGLEADIAFAARFDSLDMVGRVTGDPPVVTAEPVL